MDPQDSFNLQKAIADINAQVAQGYLSLNRDIYSNISLPQYRDVTFPGAYGSLTGFVPQDYRQPYAGRPTFGALEGSAAMMGRVGTDPRWAELGYNAGDLTSGGALNLANTRAIDASREQLVRGAEMSQANKDRQYAMDVNADPNSIVAGQILPDWLKPHAEWARQFVQQNNGRLPRYDELATTLKGFGRTPQDYLPGGQYYGANSNATVQTLNQGAPVAGNPNTTPFGSPAGTPPGPPQPPGLPPNGIGELNTAYQGLIAQLGVPYLSYNDPRLLALYQQHLGGDQATALKRAQAVSDWYRQHPGQTIDPDTQRSLYETAGAAGAAGAPASQGRGPMVQGGPAAVRQGGPLAQGASVPGRGPMVQGGPYMMQQLGPGGQSGPPGRSAQGGPTMQIQPAMMQALGGGGQAAGGPRYGIEPWQQGGGGQWGGGGLDYGGSGNTAGIGRGQAMGYDQRNLIERGRQFDVNQQFQHQGQQADIALRALQQESQLRADPFQLAQYRSGLGQTGIPGVIDAVAGRGVLPGVQGGYGAAPQRPTLGNQIGQVNQPTFGQASADQQAAALGNLSQINAKNYLRAGPGGQSYVNSAYRYAGQAQNDQEVADAARRALPQFARRGTPTFGRYAV